MVASIMQKKYNYLHTYFINGNNYYTAFSWKKRKIYLLYVTIYICLHVSLYINAH